MKLLTLNVWNYTRPWPMRRDAIVRLISTLQPDVVAMQETRHDFRFERGLGQGEQVARRTGYTATWALAQTYLPIFRVDEGLTILTRDPPQRKVVRRLSLLPAERDDENHRICLGVELQIEGRSVYAFCTHFSLSSVARLSNAHEIASFVQAEVGEAPAFVMGDLNESPDEPAIRYLTGEGGFKDLWLAAHPETPGFTYASWKPYHRIDFVLACNVPASPSAAELVGGEAIIGVFPSDHLGISIDISVDR